MAWLVAGASRPFLVALLAMMCISSSGAVEELQDQTEEMVMSNIATLSGESKSSDPMEQQFSTISQTLKGVKSGQVSETLNKHFTPTLWKQWQGQVLAKKLDQDTAEGVLNSYLCAKLKDPAVLVNVIDWVRKKGAAGSAGAGAKQSKPAAKEPQTKVGGKTQKLAGKAQKLKGKAQEAKAEAAGAKSENKQLQKKIDSLQAQVSKQKAKTAQEKAKSNIKVEKAKKKATDKAAVAVKTAESKTKETKKQAEKKEEGAKKKEEDAKEKAKTAEKKVSKVKKAAAKKVQSEQKKAQKQTAKADKKVATAKKEEKKVEAKAAKVQAKAKKVVKKAIEVKKEKVAKVATEHQTQAADKEQEQRASSKQESQIKQVEKAAVAKLVKASDPKSFDKSAETALQQSEQEAEVKTVALAKMEKKAQGKVADANEILEHATKINKFVGKADELLKIAKMSEKHVEEVAKKEQRSTVEQATQLQQLEVGRAKAKLAKVKHVLQNAVKDAKQVVQTEDNKLTAKESEFSATKDSMKSEHDSLVKYTQKVAAQRTQLAKVKEDKKAADKNLARAQTGSRLALQSEIPEAIRIANSQVTKRQVQASKAVKDASKLEAGIASNQKQMGALKDSVKLHKAREAGLIKEISNLKNKVIPHTVKITQARIKTIQTSMGPTVNKILQTLHNSQKVPKAVQIVQNALSSKPQKVPMAAQLQKEMEKRKAAEADARILQNEIAGMKKAEAAVVAPVEKVPVNVTSTLKSVAVAKKKTNDVTTALGKLNGMIVTVSAKKKALMADLTGAAPQSAQEIKTMKSLQETNDDLRKLLAAKGRLQNLASQRTENVAKLSADGVDKEKEAASQQAENLTSKSKEASLKVVEMKADIQQQKKAESAATVSAQAIQSKILQTKLLIKAAGSGSAAKQALSKLEDFENQAASLKHEEEEIKKQIKSDGAHIGVQEAAIQSDKHEAAEVLSKAKKDEKKLVVEETEAKDEHKKFAKSAALVVAQATAVTEKHLRQKIETQASAQVAKAESRVAELKARLAAASAAAASVSDSTKQFLENGSKQGIPVSSESGDISSERAAIAQTNKQSQQLEMLDAKAAGKLSTVKAELKLAQTSNQQDAISIAEGKVAQYTNDRNQIKASIKEVKAAKASDQKELSSMEKVQNVESADRNKVAAFQSEALKKWSEVHKIAYGDAKNQLNDVAKMKKAVKGEMLNEHELVLTKDEEIQRLKLALNLATNPQQKQAVQLVESKEVQLQNELERSSKELKGAEARRQELRHLIAKAEQDKDEHHEIIYGAEAQDLVVSIKRGKLHEEALGVALKAAKADVHAIDTQAAQIGPDTPAVEAVNVVEPSQADKPTDLSREKTQLDLEDQLRAEKAKLSKAQAEDEEEALKKSEAELEKQKASLRAQEDKEPTPASTPPQPESTPNPASEDRAKQAAKQAQKLLDAGKESTKNVKKAATEKDKPTQLGESNAIAQNRASLLKAELQLKKQQNLLLKVEGNK